MNEKYPFNEALENLDAREMDGTLNLNVKKFENRDDFVVKECSFHGSVEEGIEIAKSAKALFEELSDDYGIAVPEVTNVLGGGNTRGGKTMFVIADKIIGKNLWELPPSEAVSKFNEFYLKTFKYLEDAYRYEKPFLLDIAAMQAMYGHRKGESSDRIYFVDTDPFLERENIHPLFMKGVEAIIEDFENKRLISATRKKVIFVLKEDIAKELDKVESFFNPPIKLTEAREALGELMRKIESGELEK